MIYFLMDYIYVGIKNIGLFEALHLSKKHQKIVVLLTLSRVSIKVVKVPYIDCYRGFLNKNHKKKIEKFCKQNINIYICTTSIL